MKKGKRFTEINKDHDKTQRYSIEEAVKLVKSKSNAKFDETIDISFNLNLLPKHTIRDAIALPHSFGKSVKVLVFASGEKANDANSAGADFVGDEDLVKKISEGWMDFDVAIATPDMMKIVGKVAKILGPKGLMPNPKTKTVTDNVKDAVSAAKKGQREFRANKAGIINFSVGKASMDENQIKENLSTFFDAIKKKRPTDLKGEYIKSITLSSTMGVGVRINQRTI
ncbi:50S ribosomal protein L1 [Spirochaetota bacterium]